MQEQDKEPVFPDIMLGATMIDSSLSESERCALYVALIVPESNWYGAASLPVGVIGAGSSPLLCESLNVKEPLAGAPSSEILLPKALYVKLNSLLSEVRRAVSWALTSSRELRVNHEFLAQTAKKFLCNRPGHSKATVYNCPGPFWKRIGFDSAVDYVNCLCRAY